MSREPFRWRHIIINTHGTWLHGDPRGFRSREHRIHSSGDYKNPPPADEHAGLYRYQLEHSRPPVELPKVCWQAVGQAILKNLATQNCRTAIIAVTPTHVHHLTEIPDDPARIRELVGWEKRFATRAARALLPSLKDVELWAEGEAVHIVDSEEHYVSARNYIRTEQGSDAWIWQDEMPFAE
jgi:REP element-mobilizing transposase RayT